MGVLVERTWLVVGLVLLAWVVDWWGKWDLWCFLWGIG